jgi:hypothetical protein
MRLQLSTLQRIVVMSASARHISSFTHRLFTPAPALVLPQQARDRSIRLVRVDPLSS